MLVAGWRRFITAGHGMEAATNFGWDKRRRSHCNLSSDKFSPRCACIL